VILKSLKRLLARHCGHLIFPIQVEEQVAVLEAPPVLAVQRVV
jgi:hypothetical protein